MTVIVHILTEVFKLLPLHSCTDTAKSFNMVVNASKSNGYDIPIIVLLESNVVGVAYIVLRM